MIYLKTFEAHTIITPIKNIIKLPSFKEWFGDSVTVKNGTPVIFYHGSSKYGFESFNDGLNYFTPDKKYAANYMNDGYSAIPKTNYHLEKTPGIYEVFLKIENPFDTHDGAAEELFWDYTMNHGNQTGLGTNGYPDWSDAENLYQYLIDMGQSQYDGLIIDEAHGYVTWCPFHPNQIKSATGENTTFDSNNQNIYK